MLGVKVLLLLIGILLISADDDEVKIPILGPVLGAVEGAFNSAADAVGEGEQIVRRGLIADYVRKALNRFKELMVNNIELLGLPRLEPLDIEHIDIDIKHEIGVFNGTLDNVRIHNLSTFETRAVTVHGFAAFDIDLNLFFKSLVIYGDYDIKALVGDLFNVFGTGPFELILHDVNTFVNLKKLRLSGKNFQFRDIHLNVTLGNMTSNFTNLMGGGEPEKLFNKVIEQLAPEAVEVLWPEIEPIVSSKMKEIIRFSLIPNKFRRFTDGLQINLSPITSLFGFNARFHFN